MRRFVAGLLLLTALAGCAGSQDDPARDGSAGDDPDSELLSHLGDTYSVFPGNYSFDHPLGGSDTLAPGWFGTSDVTSTVLTSELDGADIDLSYWLPTASHEAGDPGPVPVIIQASPYFPVTDAPGGSQNFGQWIHDVFVPHGYAYVQLAIRSTAGSGGCDDFRGPNMNADMDQAIDWIVAQDWSTDSVALTGKSYPGSTPWYAAGTGNPHIKTIVPTSGSTNAWEVYNRNGTPESRAAAIVPTYGATAIANTDRSPEHKVENFACVEVYQGWANGVTSGASGERVTDDWWDQRNSKPSVEANYEGSIFLVHGLEDWNVDPAVAIPWTQELADSGLEVKQLLGQWAHDWPDQGGSDDVRRYDWGEMLLRWFDRELKGLDVDVGPPVQVQDNSGRWRDETAWPPKDAEAMRLHLGQGTMGTDPAPAGTQQILPGSDPIAWRMPVDETLHISGLPTIHVTVEPLGPAGYLGAILYDVAPDGSERRIGWTGMNFRYADGTETPQVVVPGQPLVLKMQLQPLDAVVEAGHSLELRIGPTLAPSDRIPAPHPYPANLRTGGDTPQVALPVIQRGDEAFFEPPMPA